MTRTAGELYERMGQGNRLRVDHDSGVCSLFHTMAGDFLLLVPINRQAFEELRLTGFIHKLTEHGEPPPAQRKRGDGWRNGWRELNLDGEIADWWVLAQ
jgi:hypothetical protein